MAENKTKATEMSVQSYLSSIEDESRRRDCEVLTKLMSKVTKQEPKMWGTSIVGFGSYHYKYESGREGDAPVAGYSSRKGDITLYLAADSPAYGQLLAKLGKHKTGKGCLYIRKLSDVDMQTLESLIAEGYAQRLRNHP